MRFGAYEDIMGGVWKATAATSGGGGEARAESKDVVIIGNGPSAITLSYMLAGNFPYYADAVEHPVDFLHHRLDANRSVSLFHQDLRLLSEGLEGRSNNPVSVLFDNLVHANADLGEDVPSFLRWKKRHGQEIEHVVLGRGLPGGSWQFMEPSSLTLSLSTWMELPNLGYKEWEQNKMKTGAKSHRAGGKQSRASVGNVAEYFQEYVKVHQLEKYFRNYSVVTSVQRLPLVQAGGGLDVSTSGGDDHHHSGSADSGLWEVRGFAGCEHSEFRYVTPRVVLATGVNDVPNRLDVPGETLPFVFHSASRLEQLLANQTLKPYSDPVLVVGAGLSAADAIISARFYGVPVAHAFRRSVEDSSLVFRKLPENMYPEYHKVYQMMRSNVARYHGYRCYARHEVLEFLPGHKVRLEGPDASLVLRVSCVLVLIGSKANLSFLVPDDGTRLGHDGASPVDCKNNTMVVDSFTHESVREKGLYAIGPLVGDNFVRFLQGGALAVANHVYQLHRDRDAATTAPGATDDAVVERSSSSRPYVRRSCSRSAETSSRVVEVEPPWSNNWPPTDPDDHAEDEAGHGGGGGGEGSTLRLRWFWLKKLKRRRRRFSHPVCDKSNVV